MKRTTTHSSIESASMKNKNAFWKFIVGLSLMLFMMGSARAVTYTWINAAGGAWTTNANWSPNTGNPNLGADIAVFNIAGTYTVTMSASRTIAQVNVVGGDVTLTAGAAYSLGVTNNLSIASSCSLSINTSNIGMVLSNAAGWTNNGYFYSAGQATFSSAGNNTQSIYTGSGTAKIDGTVVFNKGNVVAVPAFKIDMAFILQNVTFNMGVYTTNYFEVTKDFTVTGGSSTCTIGASGAVGSYTPTTVKFSGGNLIGGNFYIANSQCSNKPPSVYLTNTLTSATFTNITFQNYTGNLDINMASGSTVNVSGNIDYTLSKDTIGTQTLSMSGTNNTLAVGGNVNVYGYSTGSNVMNAVVSMTGSGNNLNISGNLKADNGNSTGTSLVSMAGTSNTINVTGDVNILAGNNSITMAASSGDAINVKGNWNNNATFTAGSNTGVTFNGTSSQTIGGSVSTNFYNLTIANTTTAVLANINSNVAGTLTVNANAILTPAAAVVFNNSAAAGTVTGSGTIKITRTTAQGTADLVNQYKFSTNSLGSMTVDYTAADNQTVNNTVGPYGHLILSGGSSFTKTIQSAGAITVNGNITISASTVFHSNSQGITIGGNWINNNTFTQALGSVTFNGAVTQNITGSNSTTYYNLTINNSAGGGSYVNLQKPTYVTNLLTMSNGLVLSTSTNLLIMNSASSVTGASDASFVAGPVQKVGSTDFTFPVGKDAKYRSIGVSNLSSSDTYTAEYIHVNPDLDGFNVYSYENPPLDHVSHCEYWTLDNIGSSSANVTLSWDNAYSCGITGGAESDLRVSGWDGSSMWMDDGNISFSTIARTVTSNTVTSFNVPFTLASIDPTTNPLPVTLVYFNVNYNGKTVDLDWRTLSEVNNDKFTVDKSKDGLNYVEVATVNGVGNSTVPVDYHTTDDGPYSGLSYYRLKQTDIDGQYKYFGPVALMLKSTSDISVYPNVTDGTFYVAGNLANSVVRILAADGKEVFQWAATESPKYVNTFDLSSLSSGVYFISVQNSTGMTQKKIIRK